MQKKREGSLDLLKFLATGVIVMHHYQQISRVRFDNHINFYNGSFYWGYLVELFFIISGYFTFSYAGKSDTLTFASFWGKKYRRFLPLLISSGAGYIAYHIYMCRLKNNAFGYDVWECLAGMLGFSRWFSESIVLNNPTWYISVLLLCYVAFYCADFFARKLKANPGSVYLAAMAAGVIMYYVCDTYNFSMPLFSMSIGRGLICFFLGLVLHEAMEKYRIHEKTLWVLACAAYAAAFVWLFVKHRSYVEYGMYYLLVFTVFPSVLIVFRSKPMQWLCPGKVFSALGNVSYHAYMWHVVVIEVFLLLCRSNRMRYNTPSAMYACVGAAMAAGLASWLVFEAAGLVKRKIASLKK